MTARRELEIRIRLPGATSDPAEVLAYLEQHQLPPITHRCYAERDGLMLLLTTNQPEKVQQALRTAGYSCQTHPVVVLGPTAYRPGEAARLLAELGKQGVDIQCSYLSASSPDRCFMIVETTNDERAVEVAAAAA